MAIGDLYNAANVKVGQAALLVAPANTAPATPATAVLGDPFSLVPWASAVLQASATLTAGNFTVTYTLSGTAYTTSSLPFGSTAVQVHDALVTALTPLGALTGDVITSGGPVSSAATPITMALVERLLGGVFTITPTGITGGTLSITQPLWTPVGATDQGWTWASAKTMVDTTVEEQSTPVARAVSAQQINITGALSEDISSVLAMTYNMTIAATAQTATVPSFETLTLSDNTIQYAVALLMANPKTYPRWLYIPVATCMTNVTAAFRRAAAKRMYTAEFSSVCATNQIVMTNITGPHT